MYQLVPVTRTILRIRLVFNGRRATTTHETKQNLADGPKLGRDEAACNSSISLTPHSAGAGASGGIGEIPPSGAAGLGAGGFLRLECP